MTTLSEHVVTMPIANPDTTGTSRTFRFVGKLDQAVQDPVDKSWTLVDWKCVSDIGRFVRQKTLGYQADLYALALALHPTEPRVVSRIEYRLIEIPTIRLCAKDKSRDDYEARCYQWLTESPGRLLTHELFPSPARNVNAIRFLWDVSKRILEARTHDCWLCNEAACYTWNRECDYLPLCMLITNGANPSPMIMHEYEPRARHQELPPATTDHDLETLTYSSASTFSLCQRLYYWRYETAIKPRREEMGEAAATGSAVHEGMDALAKTGCLANAIGAIGEWARRSPAMGEDIQRHDQMVARARAMCRAAALKWCPDSSAPTQDITTEQVA